MLQNLARHGVELVHGSARLLDANTIEVTDDVGERRRMTTDVILIVTGSSPFRPPGIPFEDPDVHDSDSILEIDHVPASLAVFGGGVIGCEYASMFAVLGTDVHLVERRTPLLPFLDTEIVERMTAGMRDLGVTFHLGERADAVARRDGALVCTLPSGDTVSTEKVLVTAGRVGNTADLGLDELGYIIAGGLALLALVADVEVGAVLGPWAMAATGRSAARSVDLGERAEDDSSRQLCDRGDQLCAPFSRCLCHAL